MICFQHTLAVFWGDFLEMFSSLGECDQFHVCDGVYMPLDVLLHVCVCVVVFDAMRNCSSRPSAGNLMRLRPAGTSPCWSLRFPPLLITPFAILSSQASIQFVHVYVYT